MSEGLLVFLAVAGLLSVILVVVIWQLASTWRAKAALVREGEYRRLGERAIAGNEATLHRLDDVASRLAEVQARLSAIEKSLTVIE
ncbi:hypothetical protein [Agromyces neolithicus]|uniref:Uncharacterized protein n=1 Tax=Agromyces neolithicus TaxID=269420 RepID=A0ABN2M0S7_9MICO